MRTYAADYQRAVDVARASISEAGLAIEEVNEVSDGTTSIIARKGSSAFSYGEYVRVLVERTGRRQVTVRVLTKKKLKAQVFARGGYSRTIFSLMDSRLGRKSA